MIVGSVSICLSGIFISKACWFLPSNSHFECPHCSSAIWIYYTYFLFACALHVPANTVASTHYTSYYGLNFPSPAHSLCIMLVHGFEFHMTHDPDLFPLLPLTYIFITLTSIHILLLSRINAIFMHFGTGTSSQCYYPWNFEFPHNQLALLLF